MKRRLYTMLERERKQQEFSKEIPQYHLEVKSNGAKVLVEDKQKINIYDRIQAANVGTDVKDLVRKYALTGDPSALQKVQGQYGDFSAVTGSLIEMQARLDNAKTFFESQPLDFRKEFDNDIMKFLAAVDSGAFTEKPVEATVAPAATPGAAPAPAAEPAPVQGVKYE